jgi:6-phosphogluconolactonase
MSTASPHASSRWLVVGGYTEEQGGSAPGISVWRPDGGTFALVDSAPLSSPSYLTAHPHQPLIFAAGETGPASVTSLRVAADGQLTVLSSVRTGGDHACHVALSPDGHHLVAANYSSGSVSSFRLNADGTLSEARDVVAFAGSGPNAERQDAPHAHQAVWDGDVVLVCDLGTDLVHRLSLDQHGRFAVQQPVRLPAGTGPRHCVVMGDYLVVACELSGELWLGRRSSSGFEEMQCVPSSSAASDALVQPSAILAAGQRVLVANRGVGTIASYDLTGAGLQPVSEFSAGGSTPRDMTLEGSLLWVCNQADDVITAFDIDQPLPGAEAARLSTPSPACVVVVPTSTAIG